MRQADESYQLHDGAGLLGMLPRQSSKGGRRMNLIKNTLVERWFIAVHRNGFGVDTDPVKAIRAAQESVALKAKPSQLALYVADRETEPTGFVTWSNGVQPRLIGLTNTHQGWTHR
jgi:hypothetical protein